MSSGSELLDGSARAPRDAARDLCEAQARLDGYASEYSTVRQHSNVSAIARARNDWGLAAYECAQALVAFAEAEDRKYARRRSALIAESDGADSLPDGRGPAGDERGHQVPASAECDANDLVSARERRDACWRDYDSIRRNSEPLAVLQAREEWEQALFDWVRALVTRETAQDQENIDERRRRQERAMQFRPTDTFPRARPRSQQIVYESRERARREGIKRAGK